MMDRAERKPQWMKILSLGGYFLFHIFLTSHLSSFLTACKFHFSLSMVSAVPVKYQQTGISNLKLLSRFFLCQKTFGSNEQCWRLRNRDKLLDLVDLGVITFCKWFTLSPWFFSINNQRSSYIIHWFCNQ